jgi:hypothetical protein
MAAADEVGHAAEGAAQDEAWDTVDVAHVLQMPHSHPEVTKTLTVCASESVQNPPLLLVGDADVEDRPGIRDRDHFDDVANLIQARGRHGVTLRRIADLW